MMSDAEQRQKVVRYWWEKSKESLASAGREFSAGASFHSAGDKNIAGEWKRLITICVL